MARPVLHWAVLDTPIGPMLAAASDRGVAALTSATNVEEFLAALHRRFPTADARAEEAALAGIAAWLTAFLAGERADLPAVDLTGLAAFDTAVYRAVRAVAAGSTATYGEVAAAIGAPRAARAVGGALSRCPLFPAVPCHRVVRASDGWSGWGGGNIALKRRLLALERDTEERREAGAATS